MGRPIAYLSGLRTLVQEEVSGIPLKDVLIREDEATQAVRKVAGALRVLHLDPAVVPQDGLLWKEKEVAILKRVGKLLGSTCPHLRSGVEETVGAVVAGLEEVPPAPTHGDLKLAHIFLDGDRLALVDLDSFAGADPVLDVARLSASLANAAPLLPQDRARAAARAFAEEYFAHAPEAWRARFPLRYAGAVLKTAGGTIRRQTPGWPEKVEALVEEAKGSLEGRVW